MCVMSFVRIKQLEKISNRCKNIRVSPKNYKSMNQELLDDYS